jgi:hypothetical protein
MKTISFRDNVGARHGEVLRSSAIFYVREDATIHSTISFMNYWKLKSGRGRRCVCFHAQHEG